MRVPGEYNALSYMDSGRKLLFAERKFGLIAGSSRGVYKKVRGQFSRTVTGLFVPKCRRHAAALAGQKFVAAAKLTPASITISISHLSAAAAFIYQLGCILCILHTRDNLHYAMSL